MPGSGAEAGPLRLAELVAALSLATDIGTGQPLEHALHTCLLALELSRRSGVGADQLSEVYYLALLRFVGCTADAAETAAMTGGDDIAFIAGMGPAFMGTQAEQARALVRSTGAGLPPWRRVRHLAAVFADTDGAEKTISAHCEAAQRLSARLGVQDDVTTALELSFARWDGRGIPGHVAAEEVPAPVRVAIVARDIDLWTRLGGHDAARAVVARRSGRAYDPSVAAAYLADPEGLVVSVQTADVWEAAVDAEPTPWRRVPEERLAGVLTAFADFTDLKSPWLRGHSTGVAGLAAAAGEQAGCNVEEVRNIHLAGLLHDVGRVGVPNGVWDHPGPLSLDGWEKVRLHTYLTERVLSRSRRLASLARLAACHHERVDGSGYHRGAAGDELSRPQLLLAAADAYHAMTEERPHRPALTADEAKAEAVRMARSGHLDAAAVEAVLAAAGHATGRSRSRNPADLTDREVEVLRQIARGRTNREVAEALVVSPKTVGTHVEHIYRKAGVRTRAGAALFAMEHGLLDADEA